MKPERVGEPDVDGGLARYPLLDAMRGRRSRRFGMGMKIPDGPFAYESRHEPLPLTEAEEAALAFAACGVTGYALADLSYGRGQGGGMLAGFLGRTVASPDAINTVSVFVTNDEAMHLLLKSLCPPYYPSMEVAVHDFVRRKFGPRGVFRGGAHASGWQDPDEKTSEIPAPTEAAIQATIAYCDYVFIGTDASRRTAARSEQCWPIRHTIWIRTSTSVSTNRKRCPSPRSPPVGR